MHTDEVMQVSMMYVPNYIKISCAIQKLMKGNKNTEKGEIISVFIFYLKMRKVD
jgi:hypothetical protein